MPSSRRPFTGGLHIPPEPDQFTEDSVPDLYFLPTPGGTASSAASFTVT
jgi:hypothetical protein